MNEIRTYRPLTLDQLIERLTEIGDAEVWGLDGQIHSDRGSYERNATSPCAQVSTGRELARLYDDEIGGEMWGWKGGEYFKSGDQPVAYAEEGDTGAYIAALEVDSETGRFIPVLAGEWW